MKIVLDLQGAQSHSRHRGIGRYTLSMAKAFAVEASHHELWLSLNGRDDETSLALMAQFEDLIPRQRMVINELPAGIAGVLPGNRLRQQMAAAAQATFIDGLQADCVWHSSVFEGWGDDSTAGLGTGRNDPRHVATLYDLIPFLHPGRYLNDPAYSQWYYRRLALLKRCGLLLAISESSRREAIDQLHVRADDIVVVLGAADPVFRFLPVDETCWARWKQQWRLEPGFVLYAGGFDAHKNVDAMIAAFADLPASLRQKHPLVLAGRCATEERKKLYRIGRQHGLSESHLIFTGTLDDEELARLYSNCRLFVSPSLHEGLGLPLLEAMACGAAVIGSDAASLPEVIGRADALFDPRSPSSMGTKLHEALSANGFIEQLRAHAKVQTLQFNWPTSARRALAAIEKHAQIPSRSLRPRPRLIYVSPLPPARSGIADYSAQLLRDLSTHYAIDVVVDQLDVVDPWVQANFPIRSLRWFAQESASCKRVLYHFGNSPYHAHMFGMLAQHPGVIVLHDSWLGAARNWMAHQANEPNAFWRVLYDSHGYKALLHDQQRGRASTLDDYPVNRDVIAQSLGVIVHSDYAVQQARRHYGNAAAEKFVTVPFPKGRSRADRRSARRLLGIATDDFVVCSFGMLAPTKLNHRLLAAWLQSSLAKDEHCQLVFVGENDGGDYGQTLESTVRSASGQRIRISGYVSADTYGDYLGAADVVVQLRTNSRGETSAAIFDALSHGLPLIINANGSAAELPENVAAHVGDRFTDAELAETLQSLKNDAARRAALAAESTRWIEHQHHPATVAAQYRDAIERFTLDSPAAEQQRLLTDAVRHSDAFVAGSAEGREMRQIMAANAPRLDRPRVYVDVTATASTRLHTGIERVVRGVLSSLWQLEQDHYRIEPVRLENGCYRQANRYGVHLLDYQDINLPEDEVVPRAGDILLGLDWVADILPANTAVLDAWRVRGVRMIFVVYDLLPVRMPTWFPDGIAEMHARWLQCIGHYADELVCISRSVTDDLRRWFDEHPPARTSELPLGYFYPGNDPSSTRPTTGLPSDALSVLAKIRALPSFLMVGTIEPRKGHAFVLEAFEQLWTEGLQACLVIVGRQGWMSDALTKRLRDHARAGSRLIWLEQVSDEYLEQIYDAVRALVAASEGEGFGLPLVEAGKRGLPVIARDMPVFREVSAAFADYFDGRQLASLLEKLRKTALSARPDAMPTADAAISWQETTKRLWEMIFDVHHQQRQAAWKPR